MLQFDTLQSAAILVLGGLLACAEPSDRGPIRVGVDATHDNHHTLDGTYQAFGRVIDEEATEPGRRWEVRSVEGALDPWTLAQLEVLVIAAPSEAITRSEVQRLEAWVRGGGALFLVVDHHPFPGAAKNLAAAFGFTLLDGWLHDGTRVGELALTLEDGTLRPHALTAWPHGEVERIVADGGAAFAVPRMAREVGLVPAGWWIRLPAEEMSFRAEGLAMLAALEWGRGRVVLSGEASMLTCQPGVWDPDAPRGMCAPGQEDQRTLVLNAVHWLATGEDPIAKLEQTLTTP